MRILVVEDNEQLLKAIKKGLEKQGYAVDTASDGEIGLEKAELNEYDQIILDLNLPKLDGTEVCRKIRESGKKVGIIMLTARADVDDIVEGLETGADDYITKPFSFEELFARIEALTRRKDERIQNVVKLGDIKIDFNKKRVWKSGKELKLSSKEYGVLAYLINNKGAIISPEKLFEHVWNEEANQFSKTLKVHINNLRKKIDSKNSDSLIQTIRNQGYLVE